MTTISYALLHFFVKRKSLLYNDHYIYATSFTTHKVALGREHSHQKHPLKTSLQVMYNLMLWIQTLIQVGYPVEFGVQVSTSVPCLLLMPLGERQKVHISESVLLLIQSCSNKQLL